ncbi:plasminogen activator inhibitor 1 [Motacilla alba alba]|uniref:plasminogen activator inhibitor 1 n=1 Tax=Motacilla alba alba TaxID=1094192 RepID=UPI0018D51E69|nr:plasminogen activator inhibitor 1 [Motacilla alba alba]
MTDFGLRLFRAALAARGDTNVVFAPYGATSVLVALQVATAGTGRQQLEAATGFSIDGPGVSAELRGLRRALRGPGHTLEVAQGLFVARGVALRGGFVTRLARALGPRSLARLDLGNGEGARRVLNAWARERTRGLVASLVAPGAVAPGARLLVASADFFGGAWGVPFPPRATRARPFRRPDGTEGTVPMMAATLRLRCGDFETPAGVPFTVAEVPYAGGEVALLLVAPVERHVPAATLARLLDAATVTGWVTKLHPAPRVLVLPRFSLETSWDLRGPLKALGVLDLFDPDSADFSPLTGEERLVLGQVLQKARMEVTESGTEAASASAAVVYSRMAPPEIVLDRPFLFLIRHRPTGTVLFVGQVTEP